MKIGKWDIPQKLYDEYVRWRFIADSYLNKTDQTSKERGVAMTEFERSMRWQLSVKKVMELHREICKIINVPYSEETDDEFYKTFHSQVEKDVKLKG